MQAVVTGSILHARPPHPNWRNQLRIGERSTAATPTAHRLAAEILLGAPSARLPAQLHRLLVRTEEDETAVVRSGQRSGGCVRACAWAKGVGGEPLGGCGTARRCAGARALSRARTLRSRSIRRAGRRPT
eukprot:6945226-Prymnesium_polylepis.1